jgi:hypothetical protein
MPKQISPLLMATWAVSFSVCTDRSSCAHCSALTMMSAVSGGSSMVPLFVDPLDISQEGSEASLTLLLARAILLNEADDRMDAFEANTHIIASPANLIISPPKPYIMSTN